VNSVLLALFVVLALRRKFAARIGLVELELFKICNSPMTSPDHWTCVGGRCPKWDGTRSGDQSNYCNETEDTLPARTLLHEAERVARKRTANLVHRPISRSRAAE